DAQTRRLIVEDLLHNAAPRRLRDALRLHHDPVSRMRFHCSTSSPSDSTSASLRAKGASETGWPAPGRCACSNHGALPKAASEVPHRALFREGDDGSLSARIEHRLDVLRRNSWDHT